jgi:hypothetical protein
LIAVLASSAAGFAMVATAPALASDRFAETARSMLDGISATAPLVAERSERAQRTPVSGGRSSEAAFAARLARAPGLQAFEDEYIRCVVQRALVYATATTEPSNAVAEAATVMCERERDGLVTGYRLALWGVMQVSVQRVDDPAFARAARARVELIDKAVTRIVASRIVHMRAMDSLSGQPRPGATPKSTGHVKPAGMPGGIVGVGSAGVSAGASVVPLEWRVRLIVDRL